MGSKEALFRFNWNVEKRKLLVEKYGTNNKDELRKRIEADILGATRPNIVTGNTYEDRTRNAKIRILEATATIKEGQAKHWETFGCEPSPEAQKAIETRAHSQNSGSILQADGTLKCVTCGKMFPRQAYDFMQGDQYGQHVKNEHRRDLYTMEKTVVGKLVGVDSQ